MFLSAIGLPLNFNEKKNSEKKPRGPTSAKAWAKGRGKPEEREQSLQRLWSNQREGTMRSEPREHRGSNASRKLTDDPLITPMVLSTDDLQNAPKVLSPIIR